MSSSPTPNSHFTSPKPSINSDTTYSSETEPEMCDCQNQLGHWDWSGVPRKNLPELCKRSMGINIDNAPTSQIKDDSDGDTSVTESDHEWPRASEQAVLKNLINDASGDPKEMNILDEANPTCIKGRKRRLSEDENMFVLTCKKSKKKMDIRIEFCDMKKRSGVKISVKIKI